MKISEFLMGHKAKISAIYQISGLTEEDEKTYRDMYVKECDSFINEQIFGTVAKEQKTVAQALGAQAVKLGVDPYKISELMKILEDGKMTFGQFNQKLIQMTKQALNTQMEQKFDQLLEKALAKRNNH